MKTNSQKTNQTIWLGAVISFALMLLITSPQTASAQQWNTNGNNISNANTGNVGIGAAAFDAWDTTNFKVLGLNTNSGFTIAAGNTSGNALHFSDRAYFDGWSWKYSVSSAPVANYYQGSGVHGFRVAPAGTAGNNVTWTTALFINNSGNVGIGTTGPTTKVTITDGATPYITPITELLQVKRNTTNGTANDGVSMLLGNNSNGFRIKYGGTSDRLSFIDGGAVETLSILNGGNVGIGTTSPQARLEVDGSGIIRITEGSRATPTSGAGLELSANSNGSYVGAYNRSMPGAYRPLSFYGSPYYFEGGNVGIGTPTPTEKLDVQGNIHVSGNINAKYQDVAEWVPASEQIPTGTVVVLDSTKSNQVIASTVSYDTRVAGVISERPGLALGERGDNKVLVATTGRVRVKVDASRAPIHIGDLLVTSDVPGVAMKSEPVSLGGVQLHRPGTLIGKALEPLAKGSGEILVLLSLQ